jgi:hypothetical protein
MSNTERQNRLLLAEDWKTIYQSFKYADFQSYDFDNLRRTMISYIRQNYPEDFNDYIESSEYLALIDLIAFLGQNLAFRTDLNARENFIEVAERRESILRLARLISYNPKRNQAANGLLKIESISTTEDVVDSNGNNLSNQSIIWNDGTNPNWYEQFIKVLNASLPVSTSFGRPIKKANINGVATEQYRFNGINTDIPSFTFSKQINSISTNFEIVSTGIDTDTNTLIEENPLPGNKMAFVYRDNGQGAGSSNSGFFMHFRQGSLKNNVFDITNNAPNTVVNIDTDNINDSDVWLYKLDKQGNEEALWTKVDAVEGNNVIYNSVSKGIRDIYAIQTRIEDRISLIFADGVFGNIPKGQFKVYYRTSKNLDFRINPNDLIGINVQIPYIDRTNKEQTLNLVLELKAVVENSSTSEENESIKSFAPSTYYTQNRLITGEDYNIGTLGINQQIIKTKAINRTSSGISRYYDLRDATGKYSNTLMYGADGVLFSDEFTELDSFEFITKTDIEAAINNKILPKIKSTSIKNYYYENFPRNTSIANLNITWNQTTTGTNITTGYFVDSFSLPVTVSSFTQGLPKYIEPEALIKFVAPAGKHFMTNDNNRLMDGDADHPGAATYIWSKVISVNEGGTVVDNDTGLGPVVFNDIIPNGVSVAEIISPIVGALSGDVTVQLVDQIFAYKTFGLRYDVDIRQWKLILNTNLNTSSDFSLGKQGDNTNQQLDASWLLLFETNGEKYTITTRSFRYVFESDNEIRFYHDSSDRIYDSKTGQVVKDVITILGNNNQPDSLSPFTRDFKWQVVKEYRDADGYVDNKKLEVGFFDSDDDGVVDNPDTFRHIVAPTVSPTTKYIFAKKYTRNGTEVYDYIDADIENIVVPALGDPNAISSYADGTIIYNWKKDIFYTVNLTTNQFVLNTDYIVYTGRDKIRFGYSHAANENRRIDPSSSNIMDVYMLTKTYDTNYRKYLSGEITDPVLPPSSDSLFQSYGADIAQIKSISDEVIYHPVKYKPLFGSEASSNLQAVFKIVKNPGRVVNDNDIKARVIDAVNEYFALENWDFGETFYFSELAAYIVKQVSPDLSSIVLVPRQESQSFGSMYEIKSENDEIFISAATVEDVEIIDAITASRLKATGNVVTSDEVLNTGVQSSESATTVIIGGDNTVSSSSSGSSGSGSSGSSGGGYGY